MIGAKHRFRLGVLAGTKVVQRCVCLRQLVDELAQFLFPRRGEDAKFESNAGVGANIADCTLYVEVAVVESKENIGLGLLGQTQMCAGFDQAAVQAEIADSTAEEKIRMKDAYLGKTFAREAPLAATVGGMLARHLNGGVLGRNGERSGFSFGHIVRSVFPKAG